MRWVWMLLGGCAGERAEPAPPADYACHPLAAAWDCLGPFPSDLWAGAAGVAIPDSALPTLETVTGAEEVFAPLRRNPANGYSVLPTLVASLDAEVTDAGLVGVADDPARSLADDSPTLIVEQGTGRRIAHVAELDAMAEPGQRRLLVLRPIERLRDATTYTVAVRGLLGPDGAVAPPNHGLAAVAAETEGRAAAELSRSRTALLEAGISTDDLQLTWGFTTRSRADATRDLVRARELVLARFAAEDPVVYVDTIERDPRERVAIRLEGRVVVPDLLVPDALDPEISRLNRDERGEVAFAGEVVVPFVALVPPAALAGGAQAIQYGHGFFGDRFEVDDGDAAELGERGPFIAFAIDWKGMSVGDLIGVVDGLVNTPSDSLRFIDRVHQGMVEQMVLARAIRTSLAEVPELRGPDGPLYDVGRVDYVGSSLGGILGGTYLSVGPDVSKGTLGVAGGGFSLMMLRALPFEDFARILLQGLEDSTALQQWTALAQTSFDRIDPAVYAPYLLEDPLPDAAPDRGVLVQLGLGDSQVPNVAGRALARAYGATHLIPAPAEIWGLPTGAGPVSGAAVVEFDFGLPAPLPGTTGDLSWPPNGVHGAVRGLAAAQTQTARFFAWGGAVEATCDGPCDPE